jgi:hypothetical protein
MTAKLGTIRFLALRSPVTGRGQVWGSIEDTHRMRKTPLFSVELHV